MRCSPSVLVRLSLLPALFGAACLTQPTALPSDGGTAGTGGDAGGRGAGMGTGTGPRTDTGAGTGACNPDAAVPLSTLEAANTADSTADITYLDDLGKHPGCSTAGLSARTNLDGTPASYTPAVIPGYPCAAKEYKPASGDDPSKNIVVLVHGNSSTPTDWETYVNDTAKTPMISGDARGRRLPRLRVGRPLRPGRRQPRGRQRRQEQPVQELRLRVGRAHRREPPHQPLHAVPGASPVQPDGVLRSGRGVIRDALRRMFRKGLDSFARIHAIHLASGANHGVSTYEAACGQISDPVNTTMAGLITCQMGDRNNFVITPFMTSLNGAQQDVPSFDTPCADGNTAFGLTGVCGCNTVVYSTVVFADPETGPLLDEFVSQKQLGARRRQQPDGLRARARHVPAGQHHELPGLLLLSELPVPLRVGAEPAGDPDRREGPRVASVSRRANREAFP